MDAMSPYPSPVSPIPGMAIRRVKGIDAPAIATLRAAWSGQREAPDWLFINSIRSWLEAEGEARITLMASNDAGPIAMFSLLECRGMPLPAARSSSCGYLDHLFVREEQRRRGVGTALIEEAIEIADRRGYQKLLVSPNGAALPLFDRLGFLMLDDVGPEGVLMVRPLPHP